MMNDSWPYNRTELIVMPWLSGIFVIQTTLTRTSLQQLTFDTVIQDSLSIHEVWEGAFAGIVGPVLEMGHRIQALLAGVERCLLIFLALFPRRSRYVIESFVRNSIKKEGKKGLGESVRAECLNLHTGMLHVKLKCSANGPKRRMKLMLLRTSQGSCLKHVRRTSFIRCCLS